MAIFPRSSKLCLKCSVKWFIGYLIILAVFSLIYTRVVLQWNVISNTARGSGGNYHLHQFHLQKHVKVKREGWDIPGTDTESLRNGGDTLKKGAQAKHKIVRKHLRKIVEQKRKPMKITREIIMDFDKQDENFTNYMANADRVLALPLLINTTHCKIPDFKPIDEETQSLINRLPPLDCPKKARPSGSRWNSKIDGENRLIVIPPPDYEDPYKNESSGRDDSISHCCYQIIIRPTGNTDRLKERNSNDYMVDLTPCATIKPKVPTEIRAEFIKVECYNYTMRLHNGAKTGSSNSTPKLRLQYREFHAIPTTHRDPRRAKILKKQDFWTKMGGQNAVPVPPNILIIGHDSTSRLHFRRQMNRTLAYLQDKGAIEFLGYTRVGENTFPNFIPALTGYDVNVYQNICANGSVSENYQDRCPLIWKDFDAANYLTAFLEDEPGLGAFHYMKPGFIEQPVDFSLRPVLLQASIDGYNDDPNRTHKALEYTSTCIGSRTNDQFILAYMKKLLKFSHLRRVPHFTFSFATKASHDYFNGLQTNDEEYAKFFEEIENKGYLKNTILFVLSDHGYRYGPIKHTLVGGYEENLPNFWVLLGPEVKEKYPKWEKMLKISAKRLTSPFNLYSTLRHILETVSISPIPQNPPENITKVKRTVKASSLFREVKEDSTCSEIGVGDQFCSCGLKRSLQLEDELTQAAGKFILGHLNGELEKEKGCKKFTIQRLVGAVIKEPSTKNNTLVTVSIVLYPGRILAEGTLYVKRNRESQFKIEGVTHVQRINRVQEECLNVDNEELRLFCHCPPEHGKGRKRI